MNLVGKIFTVLIFVFALVFMSLAVAVYATHVNWRERVLRTAEETPAGEEIGYKAQLEQARTRNQELKDQKIKIEGEVEAERKARDQAAAKLETEHDLLEAEQTQLVQQHAQVVQERRDAQAGMNAVHATLQSLRNQNAALGVEVERAEKDRDAHFKQVVQLTDELHQLINERERLKRRQMDLAEDLRKAEVVLRHFGHTKDMNLDPFPPPVDGIVSAVPQPDLVEISLGSDDGLKVGHELEVFRTTGASKTYVGKIKVMKTSYDKSACKVDPNYRQSNVQRGDRVTSRLKR